MNLNGVSYLCCALLLGSMGCSNDSPGGTGGTAATGGTGGAGAAGGMGGVGGVGGSGGGGGEGGVGGCTDNDACEATEYCALDTSCGDPGTCEPRPTLCPLVFDPVCGCDELTYDNSCTAAMSGARVSAEEPCDCRSNGDCAVNELCNAITCDGPGACELRPDVCAPVIDSVVGCDGMTYDNACIALMLGVRVAP